MSKKAPEKKSATIGENIKYFRTMRNISRKELAEYCGIGYSAIKNYELNLRQPGLELAKTIARKLSVPVDYIVKGDMPDKSDTLPDPRYCPIIRITEDSEHFFSERNIEGYSLGLSENWSGNDDYFYFRVTTDDMVGLRIRQGDLLLTKSKDHAADGNIVVATVDGMTGVYLYRLSKSGICMCTTGGEASALVSFFTMDELRENPRLIDIHGVVETLVSPL